MLSTELMPHSKPSVNKQPETQWVVSGTNTARASHTMCGLGADRLHVTHLTDFSCSVFVGDKTRLTSVFKNTQWVRNVCQLRAVQRRKTGLESKTE